MQQHGVDVHYLMPYPPKTFLVDNFNILEEVDAF